MNKTEKLLIQEDLDNGKFYSICSNETTFKEYLLASNARVRISVLEEVEGEMPDREVLVHLDDLEWVEGHNACLSQIKEIINEMKLK